MTSRTITLLETDGALKYLRKDETVAFLAAVREMAPKPRAYNLTLYYTGARRAEALAITRRDVDLKAGEIVIMTLKKHRSKKSDKPAPRPPRRIPVPPHLTDALDMVFDLKRGKLTDRLWNVTVRTANRWVNDAMERAGLDHHTPKSLRHTFGVTCVMNGIPLPMVKDLMGHEDVNTTTIYTTPLGAEKIEMVRGMWK